MEVCKDRKKYGTVSNLQYCIHNLWTWRKSFIILSAFTSALSFAHTYINNKANSWIVDELSVLSERALYIAVALIGEIALYGFVSQLIGKKQRVEQKTLYLEYNRLFLKKNLTVFYEYMENPDIRTLYKTVQDDVCGGCSAIEMATAPIGLGMAVWGFAVYGISMLSLSWLIILLVILQVFTTFILRSVLQDQLEKYRATRSLLKRKSDYCTGKSLDYTFAKDVRVFGLKNLLLPELVAVQSARLIIQKKENKQSFWNSFFIALLGMAEQAGTFYFLLLAIKRGEISPGEFVWYTSAISQLESHLSSIVSSVLSIRKYNMKIQYYRAFEDLDDSELYNKKKPIEDANVISFYSVCYRFPSSEHDVIHNASFSIHKGEKIALVGVNGAGKSTLVKLLCGLYFPTSGEITVDNQPLKDINLREYYQLFSPVFQDLFTLPLTISELIVSKLEDEKDYSIDEEKLQKVIDISGLRQKVDGLPNGIHTRLGKGIYEDGIDLSGGEIQKLLIARALYKDAPFVILDEPTSALDPLAEKQLYEEYNGILKNKTVVYISHRLSSTKFCDKIILLDGGEIREVGTHQELIRNGGKYAEMFQAQKVFYVSAEGGSEK